MGKAILHHIDTSIKRIGIENQMHWCLDVSFNLDRMQANNPNHIANRSSALNKFALAYLKNVSIYIFVGSANELQIANLLAQAKTISSGSSEKSRFVLWIALGYANPTKLLHNQIYFINTFFNRANYLNAPCLLSK
jgi:hypothetical protein